MITVVSELRILAGLEARYEALVKEFRSDSLQHVSLDRVASESDVVFVLTPGGSETKNLINASENFLRKMKKESVMTVRLGKKPGNFFNCPGRHLCIL